MAKRSNKTARVLNLLTESAKDTTETGNRARSSKDEVRVSVPEKRIKVETSAEKEALSKKIRQNLEENLKKPDQKNSKLEEKPTNKENAFQYMNVMEELYKQQDVKNFIA